MNGYRLRVNADAGESFLVEQVIQKRVTIEVIAAWLENCMKKVD